MSTVRTLLADACRRLASSPSPRADADMLMQHVLGKDRTWIRLHEDDVLTATDRSQFETALARRECGEPVAYITGSRGFWTLDLAVDAATLVPRADTEILVEWATELLSPTSQVRVLDLGTGSGAIALAIAHERPGAIVTAVDASPAALDVARQNGARLDLSVEFLVSDWFAALNGRRFDLVVANPPYIAEDDPHLGEGDLRFEPATALVAAEQGLRDLRCIISAAPMHLARGGWLLLEHGHDQGAAVRDLLNARGFMTVATRRDFGGNERISGGQWPC
ncbi:MAG TPA: peptide chain release factor N(5)-glutamine methyltransferase [Moraxellaceae bacterium]|nr:peptide chain release factor N(5)-glutamine methyltransferase [Moraxellaceae bacterium]